MMALWLFLKTFWKPIAIGLGVAVLLIAGGLFWNYCQDWIIERKITKTAEVLEELKAKDVKAEDDANIVIVNATSQVEREKAKDEAQKKKVENAEKALEEITLEEGVTIDEATKSLCLAYPENVLCKK